MNVVYISVAMCIIFQAQWNQLYLQSPLVIERYGRLPTHDQDDLPSGVIKHGCKIPELNGGFQPGKSPISIVHGFQHAMFDDTGG